MNLSSTHILWTGSGITLIYFMMIYLKLHRKKYVITTLFIVGLVSLIVGLILISNPDYKMEVGHAATALFSPILYILFYQLLRMIFIRQTGVEPAYEFALEYDREDKRGLSVFDYLVFIIPFVLAVIIPFYIG